MLHIIWGILKILGILLLAVLLLLVCIFMVILFVPIRYQLQAEFHGQAHAKGILSWICRLLLIQVEFGDKKLQYAVKIFGKTILDNGNHVQKEQTLKPSETESEETPFDPTEEDETFFDVPLAEKDGMPFGPKTEEDEGFSEPAEEENRPPEDLAKEKGTDPGQEYAQEKTAWGKKLFLPFTKIVEQIKNFFKGLSHTVKNIKKKTEIIKKQTDHYLRFWNDEKTQNAFHHCKKEFFYLLKHFRPRKGEGNLLFGTEDPALTGQILGVLCVLQAFMGNGFAVEADFERSVLEGDFYLKGHIRNCHIAKAALSLILDKNIRITLKRIRKMKG